MNSEGALDYKALHRGVHPAPVSQNILKYTVQEHLQHITNEIYKKTIANFRH